MTLALLGQPRRLRFAFIRIWGLCCFVDQWLFSGKLDTASRSLFNCQYIIVVKGETVGLLLSPQ